MAKDLIMLIFLPTIEILCKLCSNEEGLVPEFGD